MVLAYQTLEVHIQYKVIEKTPTGPLNSTISLQNMSIKGMINQLNLGEISPGEMNCGLCSFSPNTMADA